MACERLCSAGPVSVDPSRAERSCDGAGKAGAECGWLPLSLPWAQVRDLGAHCNTGPFVLSGVWW